VELQQPQFAAADAAVEMLEADSADLDALLASVAPPLAPPPLVPSVVLGTIVGWDAAGQPLIAYPSSPVEQPLPALTTVPVNDDACGREAALLFVGGDPRRPLIVGLLQPPGTPLPGAVEARVDGERVEFTAEKEIVFRCGKASITLTRAGKIIIDGTHLLSRSSGANRIKGGSVQIN
jgi:Domain of unknown function (DUF6484)